MGNIDPADRYVNTWDLVNITGGNVDSSWTQADFDDVVTGLDALITAWRPQMATTMLCKEYRLYLMYFAPIVPPEDRGPDWKDDPYGNSGPPVMVVTKGVVGTNASPALPNQVAVSVTEKTAYPRHWGRTYLPPPTQTALGTNGYLASSFCTAVADAVQSAFDSWHSDELFPVVPVTQVDKEPFRGLLTVNQIQVDNVPDVIRRRRPKTTTQRVVRP